MKLLCSSSVLSPCGGFWNRQRKLPSLTLKKKQKGKLPDDYRKLAQLDEENKEYVDKVDAMRALLATT